MGVSILDKVKHALKVAESLPLNPGNFEVDKINGYNNSRLINSDHKSFCHAPSVNMLFAQDGNVNVCCHNQQFSIGKYPDQSIGEIWRSAKANELRENMKNWDLSHGCQICEADLRMGSYNEVRARHFDTLPQQGNYPSMMEFLLTNICNLECVMCWGQNSSLIRKNREKLPELVSPYDKAFLKQLEEFIPYLRETRFSGSGEAFAIDMNYEIWEMIIEKNPKCVIMVQTNGTYLNGRVKDFLARGNFQVGVSLDSLQKETYETIRLNANFDRVMENIRYFREYSRKKKMKFSISTCVMRQNWKELPAFVNFSNEMDCVATFHKVWYPKQFALDNLPAEEIKEIYEYLARHKFTANTRTQKKNVLHYEYFTNVVKQWAEADRSAEIRQKEEETERKRQEAAIEKARKEEESYVSALKENELRPYFQKKLSGYINGLDYPESEKEIFNADILGKLDAIINTQQDDQTKEFLLRQACCWPVNMVVESFKNPIEYLLTESQRLVTNPTTTN